MTVNGQSVGRTVVGTIDAAGVYCSRAAAGGGYVFMAATALDETGQLAGSARPPLPYQQSEAARARLQTQQIFETYQEALPKVGSSVADIVQLEQYVKLKVHTDGYFQVALGPGFMERDRPGAATAELAGLFPDEAVVGVTGMAIARDESAGLVKSFPADTDAQATGRKFSDVVAAGPYVFTTYFPTDNKTGVHPDVLAPIWHWRGSEARNEAAFGVQTLTTRLESVGAALSDVVDYTLFLSEVGDLYEVDLMFSEALGELAPSRTIIPTRGFAVPRREGAVGHVEGATRMEAQFRCIRPGYSVEKVAVPGPSSGFGYQSAGVRVGTLLWLSSQYSGAEHYGNTAQELDDIFEKLEVTCRNAGTGLRELLRVRALVTRPDDAFKVFGALHKVFPADPPVVSIIVAPTLQVEGATVAVDGVAYVEDS